MTRFVVEVKLNGLSWVRRALVVGSGKSRAGALIIPKNHLAVPILDLDHRLDKLNIDVPAHSKLSSETVCILDEDDEFIMTDKGTVKRLETEAKYHDEIERISKELRL